MNQNMRHMSILRYRSAQYGWQGATVAVKEIQTGGNLPAAVVAGLREEVCVTCHLCVAKLGQLLYMAGNGRV